MADPVRREAGSSLVETLVSIQLVALVMAMTWPAYRLVLSSTEPSGGGAFTVRSRAVRYVQAELEYLRSLSYLRFRDPTRCAPQAPPPFPPLRVLPAEAEHGEPLPGPPLRRAEVRVEDEPVAGPPPGGCGLRRVTVLVYGDGVQPLARGVLLRVAEVRP
ncbi:MAG: hypothetical protein RMM30_10705 [Armatimonadota bacterium]|nr:hypothetical protein [Armatimonadota bacterium]MDW8157038.1 hypothetical protein [Armatimonadota bacterium]